MAKTINQTVIATAVVGIINATNKAREFAQQIRDASPGMDKKACRALILPHVAKKFGCATKVSESNNNKGAVSLDRDDAAFEQAHNACNYIIRLVVGIEAPQAQDAKAFRFNAVQKGAASSLLEVCGGDVKRAIAALRLAAKAE